MIEDKELAMLFKTESEEHLQFLESGLLQLEKSPHDQSTLDMVFRKAHSLKGSSRLLGIFKVEKVSHKLEDILSNAKLKKIELTTEIINNIYQSLDSIRKLVEEAVSGKPANVDIESVIAQIEGKVERNNSHNGTKVEENQRQKDIVPSQQKVVLEENSTDTNQEKNLIEKYRIDTIRVQPSALDILMNHTGELSVISKRILTRIEKIEELGNLWREWGKNVVNNNIIEELKQGNSTAAKLTSYTTEQQKYFEAVGNLISQLQKNIYDDGVNLEFVANELEQGVSNIRLLRLSTIFNLFPRMVRDLSQAQNKEVDLIIQGGETAVDKKILEEIKDPLVHIIRNAIDHGIESPEQREKENKEKGVIILNAYRTASNIIIEIADDGRGLDVEAIKRTAIKRKIHSEEELENLTQNQLLLLIFAPGFSTKSIITEISGRGVGLDVVRNTITQLKGSIDLESFPGQGCTFRIELPLTLATARVLIVLLNGRHYAFPVEFVDRSCIVKNSSVYSMEGCPTITFNEQPVSVAHLSTLLEINASKSQRLTQEQPCIIIKDGEQYLGIFVDALIDEEEVVIKPNSQILKRVRNVSGATILGTGEICTVLNPQDLIKSIQGTDFCFETTEEQEQKIVLLAEDSITTRTQEKRLLESAGYTVVIAVDGAQALSKLKDHHIDIVVSDIEMPNMDGLTLTKKIREDSHYKDLPVILVTGLATEEDKRRGIEVGADAYITKSAFDPQLLLDTLRRLI